MELSKILFLKSFQPLSLIETNTLLISKSNRLYLYDTKSTTLDFVIKLPMPILLEIFSRIKIILRIFRLGIRYSVKLSDQTVLVVFNNYFYELDLLKKTYKETFKLPRGNRPLNIVEVKDIDGFQNSFYFGEYFGNFEKKAVNIFRRNKNGSWSIVYTFPKGEIEHIHNIIPDKFRNCLWILTGDFDESSCIWMAKNDFEEVIPIKRGSQKYRACVAFAEKEGLIYATDSQFETNSIRILTEDKNNVWKSKSICEINGPSIYGCKVKDKLIFSTSVEGESHSKGRIMKYFDSKPGKGIKENFSHIVGGNLEKGFNVLYKNEKDFLPFIIFQFGVITFPTGINNTDMLYIYNIGLKSNNLGTEIFNIKE